MDKIKATKDWIETLQYDEFIPLNKEQVKLLNLVKEEYNDDFILDVVSIGVTKKNNEDNLNNYHHYESEKGTVKAPQRHHLAKIVARRDPKLGEKLKKRSEEVRLSALEYGLILPQC